ncbi:MAG: hypothetical protein KAJ19_25255, partial [Gammaproteobacteria bacterium]|nr:hypothetical protein [Gammaproteobacteria bacterium]
MGKGTLVETVSPEELRRSAWAIAMHIAKQQESLRDFQARQEVLIDACQSALESIEILEGILPEGSLAR